MKDFSRLKEILCKGFNFVTDGSNLVTKSILSRTIVKLCLLYVSFCNSQNFNSGMYPKTCPKCAKKTPHK